MCGPIARAIGLKTSLMTLARKLGIFLLAISSLGIPAPAQGPAQDLASQNQNPPAPESQQPKSSEQANPQGPANPASPETQPQTTQPSPGKETQKKKRRKKKSSTKPSPPNESPAKTVVRNGSTAEPEVKFSPDTTTDQQNRQRGKVNYLLNSTNDNLKKISTRQLNPTQQDAVTQIHSYMEQAKSALTEGDLQRGENLATKARLLSDDLLKH